MNKSVTIRIPQELDDQLVLLGEEIGLSKSTLVRVAIIKYLDVDSINDYSQVIADTKEFHRINVVLTNILQSIVEGQSVKLNTSVNSLIIYACQKIVDHYADFLA